MKKPRLDSFVEPERLQAHAGNVVIPIAAESTREPRRRERRLIWPLLLASTLAASSWAIAQAATLPPLPVADAAARALVTDSAQAPIGAVAPTAGPLASAKPAPFGPQVEVILPPPPPPPSAASGKRSSTSDRKAAAAALTTTQYCDGKYGATTSASTPLGLLTAANVERANFGLAPLSWSSSIASMAQDWSNAMANAYVADNPGAGFYHDMVPSPGGQNIAFSSNSMYPDEATAMVTAHSGWMASPGHCKNILRASFTTMGAATAGTSDPKVWYTTVNFQ